MKPVAGGNEDDCHRYLFYRTDVEYLRPESRLTSSQLAKRLGLSRSQRNRAEWERLKLRFNYYSIDQIEAGQAAELRLTLRQRGWQLAAFDALIATVALRHELILLTTDRDFYSIPELRYENWRDSG